MWSIDRHLDDEASEPRDAIDARSTFCWQGAKLSPNSPCAKRRGAFLAPAGRHITREAALVSM